LGTDFSTADDENETREIKFRTLTGAMRSIATGSP